VVPTLSFNGFSRNDFDNCVPSENIRIPINTIKNLKSLLEPKIKKLNNKIFGRISRTKQQGTNIYNDWAWLYFNTKHPKGYRYSQLTINISPNRLYIGVNIKRKSERLSFQDWTLQKKNLSKYNEILASLSGREWIFCPPNSTWGEFESQRYTTGELSDMLRNEKLYWINAYFERDDPILRSKGVVTEIQEILLELYNIYAISSGIPTNTQPKSKQGIYRQEVEYDFNKNTKNDDTRLQETQRFIESLTPDKKPTSFNFPSKRDQYSIKRVALGLDLKQYNFVQKGRNIIIYAEEKTTFFDESTYLDYVGFLELIDRINMCLKLPPGFLKTMLVNDVSDARYHSDKESQGVFLNLARYKTNKDWIFWLFNVAREMSYMRKRRLNYAFINELRNFMILALSVNT